jgi:transcriptional regulator with XRE-family HTH domain
MRAATEYERFVSNRKNRRLLQQERLLLDVSEKLSDALSRMRIRQTELAELLDKSKGFVSQVLAGNRNLTLRTLADVASALDCRVNVSVEPICGLWVRSQDAPYKEFEVHDEELNAGKVTGVDFTSVPKKGHAAARAIKDGRVAA